MFKAANKVHGINIRIEWEYNEGFSGSGGYVLKDSGLPTARWPDQDTWDILLDTDHDGLDFWKTIGKVHCGKRQRLNERISWQICESNLVSRWTRVVEEMAERKTAPQS